MNYVAQVILDGTVQSAWVFNSMQSVALHIDANAFAVVMSADYLLVYIECLIHLWKFTVLCVVFPHQIHLPQECGDDDNRLFTDSLYLTKDISLLMLRFIQYSTKMWSFFLEDFLGAARIHEGISFSSHAQTVSTSIVKKDWRIYIAA